MTFFFFVTFLTLYLCSFYADLPECFAYEADFLGLSVVNLFGRSRVSGQLSHSMGKIEFMSTLSIPCKL